MSDHPPRKAPRHDATTQEVIRIKAAKAVLAGKTIGEVALVFGVSESAVGNWSRKARANGIGSLKAAPRGRRTGQKRTLTARQEKQLRKWILEKDPQQLKLPFWLWEARAVMMLIFERFHIAMPLRTVQDYLYRWNFSAQVPAVRAAERKPEVIRRWLGEEYPAIASEARASKAEIWWLDETAMQLSSSAPPKSYAPKGATPVVIRRQQRFKVQMINAVNNLGQAAFLCFDKLDSAVLTGFFDKLRKARRGRPLRLILDNLAAHKTKAVQDWEAATKGKVTLHYLPPYSPDLNPTEGLNSVAKARMRRRMPASTKAAHQANAELVMEQIVSDPQLVRSVFRQPGCEYAA